MADLPALSASTTRKLALQWSTLLNANKLTGEHLHWHEGERDRLMRVAAQSPGTRPGMYKGRATDETGIYSSVAAAEGRFNDLMAEYWQLWLSSGDGYEGYSRWLELVRQQVSAEIAAVWADGSKTMNRWYGRACRPAVEESLAVLVQKGTAQARGEELKRLEERAKKDLAAEKRNAGKPTPDERGRRAATSQFPKRAAWLEDRLREWGWSHSDPSKFGGPDRKTIERILRGYAVRNDVLLKLVTALKTKHPTRRVLVIPQD